MTTYPTRVMSDATRTQPESEIEFQTLVFQIHQPKQSTAWNVSCIHQNAFVSSAWNITWPVF